jgi:hypothetical protein
VGIDGGGRGRAFHAVALRDGRYAFTWHLRGGNATAAKKRAQRSALLEKAGIALCRLTSIDRIDAALFALAAHQVAAGGACHTYGDGESGWIVVPRGPVECGARWGKEK